MAIYYLPNDLAHCQLYCICLNDEIFANMQLFEHLPIFVAYDGWPIIAIIPKLFTLHINLVAAMT